MTPFTIDVRCLIVLFGILGLSGCSLIIDADELRPLNEAGFEFDMAEGFDSGPQPDQNGVDALQDGISADMSAMDSMIDSSVRDEGMPADSSASDSAMDTSPSDLAPPDLPADMLGDQQTDADLNTDLPADGAMHDSSGDVEQDGIGDATDITDSMADA